MFPPSWFVCKGQNQSVYLSRTTGVKENSRCEHRRSVKKPTDIKRKPHVWIKLIDPPQLDPSAGSYCDELAAIKLSNLTFLARHSENIPPGFIVWILFLCRWFQSRWQVSWDSLWGLLEAECRFKSGQERRYVKSVNMFNLLWWSRVDLN